VPAFKFGPDEGRRPSPKESGHGIEEASDPEGRRQIDQVVGGGGRNFETAAEQKVYRPGHQHRIGSFLASQRYQSSKVPVEIHRDPLKRMTQLKSTTLVLTRAPGRLGMRGGGYRGNIERKKVGGDYENYRC